MNVFKYIEQNYESFTESEKLIADYLLKNRKSIIDMSSKQIADETNTSAPTVVRFSKKIGFNTLNEMKLQLSLNLESENEECEFEYLSSEMSTKNIILGIKNSIVSSMNQTVSLIKEDDLDKAIELIDNADTIYIYGVGSSNLVAMDFYYKLTRIHKRCVVNLDTHAQIAISAIMKENDVAISISYSGETPEVIKCSENAKKAGAKVISITKSSVSNSLSQISDVSLKVPFVERELREGAMTSRISQLALIDMLYIGIAKNNKEKVEENLRVTRKTIEEFTK